MNDVPTNTLPDVAAVLATLKDFQRQTVEYIFRRMYVDANCTRRFLLADEVGLGKTLVARGVIAKTIDHLWDGQRRIDVIYVCSNGDIARQNINRLNVTQQQDVALASRITMLPLNVGRLEQRKINFVSFTPGTSFELRDSGGMSRERQLLYWLLKDHWKLDFRKATQVFAGQVRTERFRRRINAFPRQQINDNVQEQFVSCIAQQAALQDEYEALADLMPRVGARIPKSLRRRRNQFVGALRRLLAETCLHWLEPDLIILDEFQRFKHLLGGDGEEASPAAELAEHLFRFQEQHDDPDSAARVLLLSATPYKMYTLSQDGDEDDHYVDFLQTMKFLLDDQAAVARFEQKLKTYRDGLFRISSHGLQSISGAKDELEAELRRVMVRTERLSLSSDRNGMLREVPVSGLRLSAGDIQQYLGLQRAARVLGQSDVLEYWKSAPYLLNFMDGYQLKTRFRTAVEASAYDPDLLDAVRSAGDGLLDRQVIERYRELDPGNARLRSLAEDTIGREAWRLLWLPPSLPYYEGTGPYADPALKSFTKRLVFSSWNVAPKAIASVLSYQAERAMVRSFRIRVRNTPEARQKRGRRQLLRFNVSNGRPGGMPVLAMIYPSESLADAWDPLDQREFARPSPSADEVLRRAAGKIRELLDPVVAKHTRSGTANDERWYWAAPLLLDASEHPGDVRRWLDQEGLSSIWLGQVPHQDEDHASGFSEHIRLAQAVVEGRIELGHPPEDLSEVLAYLAVAGPGVASLRALRRICAGLPRKGEQGGRTLAAPLAHAFLHLFNLPEVMYLLRDRNAEEAYWRTVLRYCVGGNLQAVLDEYAHVLVESLGLLDQSPYVTAKAVSEAMQASLSIRAAGAQADVITADNEQIHWDEKPLRFQTRFAMRFGDQRHDDGSETTRADAVRWAFNSPFWPFVLATTSVGQEGLDFHTYCHAVVHWNLPSNPVDLEQREGRVHRYKGHALRKNIAEKFGTSVNGDGRDPWQAMFRLATESRSETMNDLYPFWIAPDGQAKIERHVPAIPHSRDVRRHENLQRSLVVYRMVFGQSRQEDLLRYLLSRLPADEAEQIVASCRINLSPPGDTAAGSSSISL